MKVTVYYRILLDFFCKYDKHIDHVLLRKRKKEENHKSKANET